jgi:hypothetical protein
MAYNPLLQQATDSETGAVTGNVNGNGTANSKPTFGERLGLFATTLTAIGDILAVVAANILIQEGIADAKQADQEKQEQEQQFQKMQSQIEALQNEMKSLKQESNRKS